MRLLATAALSALPFAALADPLPSWNDTPTKAAIIAFVERVSDPNTAEFVPEEARIATFDNDGTLWGEQPLYFQLIYALDRLREKAEADPSILKSDALKAAAKGDTDTVLASGQDGLLEILNVSHSGMSVEAFQGDVADWIATARHPTTGMTYNQMIYAPMLELLDYLETSGFQTWIVSGGGIHFMRAFASETYGIPVERIIGSATPTRYEVVDGVPVIIKDPGIAFVDDKAGKPVGIDSHIGRRPIFVGGNSDGDFQMLEYATAGDGPALGVIVHHTDAEREFAYDRESHIGKLEKGLDEAEQRGWVIIDMQNDWVRIWPQ
ncbi:HAD family phosphatase [Ruegeria sp. HKCCD8929]|uniref:HAD family hydrolase n=1 Tax=Ruegeria sp. HKCCD8929 TaxID=2683006 RepID=UPI001487FEE0|nr:HAD family hydrolase [Ruegeria sp. HKCCD8929]